MDARKCVGNGILLQGLGMGDGPQCPRVDSRFVHISRSDELT